MDNFKAFQAYLLSGSENDEGVSAAECILEILARFPKVGYKPLHVFFDWTQVNPTHETAKPLPPAITTSSNRTTDARANQDTGNLQLPKWRRL